MVALIIVANFTQLKMPYVIILANTICPFQKYTAGGLVTLYRTTYLIKYSFAYLDGDLYDSILISLKHVYPRLTKGAICLIDDYNDPSINPVGWNKLPGVKKACDEYLSNKPEKVTLLYAGVYPHGFFRKA